MDTDEATPKVIDEPQAGEENENPFDSTEKVEPPEVEKQKEIIQELMNQYEQEGNKLGESYFLVSIAWWKLFCEHVSLFYRYRAYLPTIISSELPPIDNSPLVDSEGRLRQEASEFSTFAFLPSSVWNLVHGWYGGGPAIERKAVAMKSGGRSEVKIDVRPLTLKVILSSDPKNHHMIRISKAATVEEFIDVVVQEHQLKKENVRVWDYHGNNKLKLLDHQTKQLGEEHILDNQPMLVEIKREDGTWPPSASSYSGGSYSYMQREPTEPGKTGLGNLGNTCFMNSALQCLSAAAPLTDYFLSNTYQSHLNPENPLSKKGEVANEYANLLRELWSDQTFAAEPRDLKRVIERYAPQFGGYHQHDSQELIAFLLDGLHEDLNQVKKKEYFETPNSDGHEDAELAALSWAGYQKRDKSKIVELFQGQLKSKVTCPDCKQVSITFDPVMYWSLPIPVDTRKSLTVPFHFNDGIRKPIKCKVIITEADSVRRLKELIGAIVGLTSDEVVITEVWRHDFHMQCKDDSLATDIDESDMVAYQIAPRPLPKPEPERMQTDEHAGAGILAMSDESSEEEHLIYVPVTMSTERPYGHNQIHRINFSVPFILSLDPTQVTYNSLYSAIVKYLSVHLKKTPPALADQIDEDLGGNSSDDGSDDSDDTPARKFAFGGVFQINRLDRYRQVRRMPANGLNDLLELQNKEALLVSWTERTQGEYLDDIVYEEHPSLAIKQGKKTEVTLEDCFDLYSTEEVLEEGNEVYCRKCQEHKLVSKKLDLWRIPPILVIHFKRFAVKQTMSRYQSVQKIEQTVQFPLDDLDMSKYIKGDIPTSFPGNPDPNYELFAISNHHGYTGGGHYTAYAKHRNDGKWYKYDDRTVSGPIEDPNRVIDGSAYVLFYRLKGMPWPAYQKEMFTHTTNTEEVAEAPDQSNNNGDNMNADTPSPMRMDDEPAETHEQSNNNGASTSQAGEDDLENL